MMKKLAFMAISALVFVGCGDSVNNAIGDAINGDTTVADIAAKDKVLIVTGVDSLSCAIVAIGVQTEYPNGATLVADSSVTCATYSKDAYACEVQTLAEVQAEYDNSSVNSIQAGDKNCVVGGDNTAN